MGPAARRYYHLAGLLLVLLLTASVAQAVQPANPSVRITSPANNHVFGPGEATTISGDASAPNGLHAVKLEYWLANRLARRVLAACAGCGTPSGTWSDQVTDLPPGYYVVKAYAVDDGGAFSDPSSRSFATGLEGLPSSPTPTVPQTPTLPNPSILEPHPERLIPGADKPIEIGGKAPPGSTVVVYERAYGLGPLGKVTTDGNGRWEMDVRLPTGRFAIVAQATKSSKKSALTQLIRFRVDGERPYVELPDQTVLVFPPTDPVEINGTVLDDRGILAIVVEYWVLDRLALRELARCPGCGAQSSVKQAAWSAVPEGLLPGEYYVKIKALDPAGNPSWVHAETIVVL